ncbi:hypothetical protein ACHAAC_14055 [Aeromicrobium sp. CF4.19]|uniref:hypothetical protein n=1 Tax=Aeromicrobium sp. CF4.19 TaxID=3373082 RepID=UPI003EE81F44
MDAQPDDPIGHDPSAAPTPPRGAARRLLLVAAVVISAEALGLIALGVTEATLIDPGRAGLGISTAIFLGFFGVLLLVGVARVLKGEAWARGLLVFSQLIQLLLSYNFRGDVWWIPTTLAVSALLALGCLLSPPVTRALNADPGM